MNRNKGLVRIKIIFIGLFILLIGNLIYFVLVSSFNVMINPYNPRLENIEEQIIRGKILDNNNNVLAETIQNEDDYYRIYPYEEVFFHVIGYSKPDKTGIEKLADIHLLQSNISFLHKNISEISNQKIYGDNVITTLNLELQLKAHELLGNQKGAIVAIEPSTGKILCMVSKPDFDPNYIEMEWENLIQDEENSPMFNRATQGLYPPGSTFKILSAIEYMNEYDANDFSYYCKGENWFDDKLIHCFNNIAHGEVDLKSAFAYSCNTAFASIGQQIEVNRLHQLAESLLFNQQLPIPLESSASSFTLNKESSSAEISETVIGQGKTLISPLHNALITATIANGGIMMKPYIIDRVENTNGKIIEKNFPTIYSEPLDTETTREISGYMKEVVDSGTGKESSSEVYTVAAKTGSAENPSGDTHAWYVGFAPVDQPEIAIAIIVENAGSSSTSAVPIAKTLLDEYLVK